MSNSSDMQTLMNRYGIVGRNEALHEALATAVLVAPTDLSVLIQGESGVGKEVIPRIIHDHSKRRGKTYIAINCGAIPEGTIDSELFGHEKGAFTNAIPGIVLQIVAIPILVMALERTNLFRQND
jgi:transcriptional regulator with GAF, ATPase, and Fis domain